MNGHLRFIQDKWERSRARVFENASCGFKEKKVQSLSLKFLNMVDSFKGWRLQCRKFTGDNCPAHCNKIERNGDTACTPK